MTPLPASSLPPIDAALAKLLNPAIERGEAGPGSQTGLTPPPDNSFDRRRDFSDAHRARKSRVLPCATLFTRAKP